MKGPEVAADNGVADEGDGRGSVRGDLNNDGYLDLFVVNVLRGHHVLYQNSGGSHNWIALRLVGTISNRSAVGARVDVVAGALRQADEVRAGSSYASMHSLNLNFGLETATIVDSIIVRWPSGTVQILTHVETNQLLTITEPGGTVDVDFAQSHRAGAPIKRFAVTNYPNPFNAATSITYHLPEAADVNLSIYALSGRLIETLEQGRKSAGIYAVKWNAGRVASGIYVLRLTTPHQATSTRMILLK